MTRSDLLPGYELRPLYTRGSGVPGTRGRRRMVAWVEPQQFSYVNVRRLLIFVEASLSANLSWTVFEPNGPKLWAAVTLSVWQYLRGIYNQGLLTGSSTEQAFFVRCDETTMTSQQISDGELEIVIGVAPVYPAEFIIIQIGAWAQNPG